MGSKTKFWIKFCLANCAWFAGFFLGARMGFGGTESVMAGMAAGASVMILLWPNNIQGEVVSNEERNSSLYGPLGP